MDLHASAIFAGKLMFRIFPTPCSSGSSSGSGMVEVVVEVIVVGSISCSTTPLGQHRISCTCFKTVNYTIAIHSLFSPPGTYCLNN
jgi:hypothetical protein